ncbi:MAG TPA: hypothetical protein VHV82_03270 [Sporichthyaceae bacterium]|nr:hypothetical protein [Sporichthyaceae bacterium]
MHNRFTGHRLELRYGPVPDDGLIPAMQAFTTVDGHRCRATAKVQQLLFTDEATDDA